LRASTFYRIASVLLLLFDVGHTLGFRQSRSQMGESTRFLSQCGQFTLTCKGLAGLIGTSLLGPDFLFPCFFYSRRLLAWQLGGLSAETLALMRGPAWGACSLLCRRHGFKLDILLHATHHFHIPDYSVFGCRASFSGKSS